MRNSRQVVLSFFVPLGITVVLVICCGIFLQGKMDCRDLDFFPSYNCVDLHWIWILDVLQYGALAAFLLVFTLPVIVYNRGRAINEDHIFPQDSSN
jgi:hypothetical protein